MTRKRRLRCEEGGARRFDSAGKKNAPENSSIISLISGLRAETSAGDLHESLFVSAACLRGAAFSAVPSTLQQAQKSEMGRVNITNWWFRPNREEGRRHAFWTDDP